MLEAIVKKDFIYPTAQSCAGTEFVKDEYRPVPEGFEKEAKNADFLQTRIAVNGGSGKVSEQAQELADHNGIDLGTINGTGSGGGITVKDVRDAIAKQKPAQKKVAQKKKTSAKKK